MFVYLHAGRFHQFKYKFAICNVLLFTINIILYFRNYSRKLSEIYFNDSKAIWQIFESKTKTLWSGICMKLMNKFCRYVNIFIDKELFA